jgi:dihydropteroate synthase
VSISPVIARELPYAAAYDPLEPSVCGSTTFAWGTRTFLMGILNVTDDSFSGDGVLGLEAAVERGCLLAANGADIVDVGGESTRPGASPIEVAEELRRVIPVIRRLRERLMIPISIDTYRAAVAESALEAGASIVNDVWGFQKDPELAATVARHGACAVATHNRAASPTRTDLGGFFGYVDYTDLLAEIAHGLRQSLELLTAAGVARERIILDPGIGFGKTPEQNLQLLARLYVLRSLGRPLLVGTSRKSVIGLALGLPPDQRVEGTAATVALAIRQGADVVRVHDLPAMAYVARMTDAVVRGGGGEQRSPKRGGT